MIKSQLKSKVFSCLRCGKLNKKLSKRIRICPKCKMINDNQAGIRYCRMPR